MRISQILLNVSGNTQLILQTETFLLVTARIGKVHTCFGGNIRQLVLTFKAFDIGIHTSQFTFDDDQTFVNKLGSIYGYLVLIIDNILIINGNKHVQDVFRTGSRDVIQDKIDNGGRLAGKRHFQSGTIPFDNTLQIGFDDIYGLTVKYIRIVQRRSYNHRADRSRNSIVQMYIQNLFRMNAPTPYS